MGALERLADRCMGYVGLFQIGAISWVADRMGPQPARRARRVSPHSERRAEA